MLPELPLEPSAEMAESVEDNFEGWLFPFATSAVDQDFKGVQQTSIPVVHFLSHPRARQPDRQLSWNVGSPSRHNLVVRNVSSTVKEIICSPRLSMPHLPL